MKATTLILLAAFTFWVQADSAHADIIYKTGTNDAMDLDFDGAGFQTSGDLGIVSKIFVISGLDLPTDIDFADITSITIDFIATNGNFSANNSAGVTSGGIGIASSGENSTQTSLLSPDSGEMFTVNVSSTSTDPSKQVQLSGMRFSSFRNAFPVAQFDLTGATIDGNNFYAGSSGAGSIVSFDTASDGVTLESVSSHASGGGDGFRLHHISLTVTSVPEPGSIAILGFGLASVLLRRRRRSRTAA